MPSVRLADASDAADLGRLLHDFNTEFEDETPGAEALARRFGPLLESGEAVALLAGSGPDGFALLRLRPMVVRESEVAYLEELYVAPELRGQGLGRALLEAAMEESRRRGASAIELGTAEDDVAARALYESAGFINREGGPDGPVMYVYERDL